MAFTARVATNTTLGSTSGPNQRKLCIDSNNRIWCVYGRTDTYSRIYAAYSDDNGITWTEEQVNDAPSSNFDQALPSIAVDSNDDIHVVWRGRGFGTNTSDENIHYRKRVDATSIWGPQEAVTDKPNYQFTPSMVVDSSGNVHVVWRGLGWGSFTSVVQIQYSKRVSSSADWVNNQEAITDINALQDRPSIALDSSGQPHVIWAGDGYGVNTADNNFQYRMRTGSWQAREPICDTTENQLGGSICLDSDDVPHVVWYGKTWGSFPSVTQIVYSSRTGGSWSTGIAIDDIGGDQEVATIAVDNLGVLHVVWSNATNGITIRYMKKTTSGWSDASSLISRATYFQSLPNIMWAKTPSTSQLASGFTFIWRGNDADGLHIEYYRSYGIFPSDPSSRVTEIVIRYTSANVPTNKILTMELLLGGATQQSLTVLALHPPTQPELTSTPDSVVPPSAVPPPPVPLPPGLAPIMAEEVFLGWDPESGQEMWLQPDGTVEFRAPEEGEPRAGGGGGPSRAI